MTVRFVHAADLHLDSPLRGLARYEGAPVERIRDATRRALCNLVDLCLEEEVGLLLLAGDLFDGDWRDYATGLFFAKQMARLREGAVSVVLVRGNHDAASRLTKRLPWPDNVVQLDARQPQTVHFDALDLVVHGQSFATEAVHDDLAASYPNAVPGMLNIGVLHTSLDGRVGHASYAPTRLETLVAKGYDYWALGHVHRREVVCESPWVVFPGNLQGRHVRETGAKGASLVTVEGGRIVEVTHRPLDVLRWAHLEVDVSAASSADACVTMVRDALDAALREADERLLCARITVQGASPAHGAIEDDPERWEQAVRAAALEIGDELWIERVRWRTQPVGSREARAGREDALGALLRAVGDLRADDAALRAWIESELADLLRSLPGEACEGDEGLRLAQPEALRAMLDDVERLILGRVLGDTSTGDHDEEAAQ